MPPSKGKCKRKLDISTSSSSANSSPNYSSNQTNTLTSKDTDETSDSDISHFYYSSPENPTKADKTEAKYYRALERKCSLSLNTKRKITRQDSREQQRRRDRSLPSRQTKQQKKRARMNDGPGITEKNENKTNEVYQYNDKKYMDENTKSNNITPPNKEQPDKHPDTETGQQTNAHTEKHTTQHDTQGIHTQPDNEAYMDENTKSNSNTLPNKEHPINHNDTETEQQTNTQTDNNTTQHDTQGINEIPQANQHTNAQTDTDTHTETHPANNHHQDPTPNNTLQQPTNKQTNEQPKMHTNLSPCKIPIQTALKAIHSRPLTETQKQRQLEVITRTVYISGETDEVYKYYKHQPHQLNKELTEQVGGPVEKVHITRRGDLLVITQNQTQKNKLLKLHRLNNKHITTSLPYTLKKITNTYNTPPTSQTAKAPPPPPPPNPTTIAPSNPQNDKVNYLVKGVVYGLLKGQDQLDEVAKAIGATNIYRIGDPETSRTTILTYKKDTPLPSHIQIDDREYKVHPYIPTPKRCDKCQLFGHHRSQCFREATCSRCSGKHEYTNCPNKNMPKCANCGQGHSAAYRMCPKYMELQLALEIRAYDNIPLGDALKKAKELGHQNPSNPPKTELHNNIPQLLTLCTKPTYAQTLKTTTNDKIQQPHHLQTPQQPDTHNKDAISKPNPTNSKQTDTPQIENILSTIASKIQLFLSDILLIIDTSTSRKVAKNKICEIAQVFLDVDTHNAS